MVEVPIFAVWIIATLALGFFALAVSLVLVIQHYQRVMGDLMDRLMARDWPEYQAGVAVKTRQPLKRWANSDAQNADNERAALAKAHTSGHT